MATISEHVAVEHDHPYRTAVVVGVSAMVLTALLVGGAFAVHQVVEMVHWVFGH